MKNSLFLHVLDKTIRFAFKVKNPWGLLNSFIQFNKVLKYVNFQKRLELNDNKLNYL